jgi:hypothetical protein
MLNHVVVRYFAHRQPDTSPRAALLYSDDVRENERESPRSASFQAFDISDEVSSMRRKEPIGPLDEILGSVGTVRVLRALSHPGHPRWSAHLAFLTDLSRSSLWDAVNRLSDEGIVEPVHEWHPGGSVPLRIARRHPLARALTLLFDEEAREYPTSRRHIDVLGSFRF